jgi:DNA helicase-4
MGGLSTNASTQDEDNTSCAWVYRLVIEKKKNQLKTRDYINAVREIIFQYKNENITILHRNNLIFGMGLEYFRHEIANGLKENNTIKISNIHKYKGDESDIIIFINATSFNHPMMHPDRSKHYILGLTDQKIINEERRLFYVAVTRAKKALHIITDINEQSPFIADMSNKS